MNITKEMIETRITELNKQEEQHIADLNAIAGARQQCCEFLKRLDESEAQNDTAA